MIKSFVTTIYVILFTSPAVFASLISLPSNVLETGTPFITNYDPSIYNAHGQKGALLSLGDKLLVSCNHGIFEYQSGQFTQISNKSAWQFHISKRDPNRIYLGLDQGISSLYQKQDRWVEEDCLPNFNANVRTLAEDSHGRLWVGTVYIVKITTWAI
jgi:ligand-binding sensor domain-containing protein